MTSLERTEFATLEQFVASRGPALLAFANAVCGRETAADLVQEALIRTGGAWSRIQGEPEPYMRTIIVRLHMRQSQRRLLETRALRLIGRARPDIDESAAVASRLDLVDALQTLPARERATVMLRHYADYSEAQTAEILDCSIGTVKSQNHRALKRLRAMLDGPESGAHSE